MIHLGIDALRRFAAVAIAIPLLSACGPAPQEPAEKAPEPLAEPLARIGERVVTEEDFEAYLRFKRLPAGDAAERAKRLDHYLERAVLAEAVERQGTLDRALLEAELEEFRKEMWISRYFEQFLRERVTEEAVRNYYAGHPEEFTQRRAKVAHILVRTSRTMSEPERQAKLTALQEARSKLEAGEPFAAVAERYSEDSVSARKGGELGWLKEGAIDPRFSRTAFALAKGEVSQPLETPFGFHLITLLDGPMEVRQPFEAVAGEIRYRLRAEAKDAELGRLAGLVEPQRGAP